MKPTAAKTERIMYVDDEDTLVYLAKRKLRRLGYQVTAFNDPQEALRAFRENPDDFQLVLTDLSMPSMNGIELARQLLALRPQLPVVITSGYIHQEEQAAALRAGVRAVMTKPAAADELRQTLDRLLGSNKQGSRPALGG